MNYIDVYNAMQKRAAGASGKWEAQPYRGSRVQTQSTWGAPEGYSNKGTFSQIGENLKNWFKQLSWDTGHNIDTVLGTKLTYGQKRPQDKDYNGSFWKAINPFAQKPYIETQVEQRTPYDKMRIAEQRGDFGMNRKSYGPIELPNNKLFQAMAAREAQDPAYAEFRRAGYTDNEVQNFIMHNKYLPLVRQVTGKQNITKDMVLTPAQMERIKQMQLDREMGMLERKLNQTSAGRQSLDNNSRINYRNALSSSYDSLQDAVNRGEVLIPEKRKDKKPTYADALVATPETVSDMEKRLANPAGAASSIVRL